jgi:hypothetical protein
MASEVKTNKVSPSTGVTVTLGDASDVFQLPASAEIDIASGATLDVNGTIDITGATKTGFPAGTSVTTTKATGTTTLVEGDADGYVVVPCDSSGGNVIIKLPAAAAAWSGSVLHIVASIAPGAGYNVVIQNSAATELAQLNMRGDYYTVTCDSGGSNLVVIDNQQTYRGFLLATAAQPATPTYALGGAKIFTDPASYDVVENYGNWWVEADDDFTVPSGWVGKVEVYANAGTASDSYLALIGSKDGSAPWTALLYSSISSIPFHWVTACTGTEYFDLHCYTTYSGAKYARAGTILQWKGTRNV